MARMNILSSINAGIFAAANGTAEIYVRGTATRAVWYPDFEASSSNSSRADIVLDAYGSAEVYINQLVDVVVKSSDGTVTRSFTDGYASGNVEVISSAFTGSDYITGMSGVSKPTTLQSVLDRWLTSAGSPNWNVLLNGTTTTFLNAFGALSGLVFNVKSPAYGAVGDGVVNDQTAIQAALAAAVAAGGGVVFFPKGTYLITTAIAWSHIVSIVGVGADLSVITTNSGTNARILTWDSGTPPASPLLISGMSFSASQANTGEQLNSSVAVNLTIDRCRLGASANCVGNLVGFSGNSKVRILDSRFTVNGTAKTAMTWSATTVALVQGCHIDTGNSTYTGSFIKASGWTTVASCVIDQTLNTLGISPTGVEMLAVTDRLTVRDTKFLAAGQNFTQCVKLFAGALALTSGNDYGFSTRYNVVSAPLANGSALEFVGAERVGSGSAAYVIPDAVNAYVLRSTGTNPTFTEPTKFFPGQRMSMLVFNNSGGNWAGMLFPGCSSLVTGSTSVVNTQTAYVELMVADLLTAGAYGWYVVDIRVG